MWRAADPVEHVIISFEEGAMKSTLLTFSLTLVLLLPAAVARGQLAPPNDAGVTMGQLNLRVRDVEATKKLFLQIGGTPTKLAPCCPDIIKYPGVLILLRKADPTGGMEGSTVNHIGFLVKDGATLMAKFKAEGLREESNGSVHGGYVFTPDGIKIEILERPDLAVPVLTAERLGRSCKPGIRRRSVPCPQAPLWSQRSRGYQLSPRARYRA